MTVFGRFARMLPTAATVLEPFRDGGPAELPAFIVQTDASRPYWVELVTDPALFLTPRKDDDADPQRFSTKEGNATLGILPDSTGRKPAAGPGRVGQPFHSDIWRPDPKVWTSLSARAKRVYYRVVFDGISPQPERMERLPGESATLRRAPFIFTAGKFAPQIANAAASRQNPVGSLPELVVVGPRLTEKSSGRPVVLRGVNLSGMQYRRRNWSDNRLGATAGPCGEEMLRAAAGERDRPGWLAAAGIDGRLLDWIKGTGANAIRLTLNQEWALEAAPRGTTATARLLGTEYLDAVDQVVTWANERGLYVILALHSLFLWKPTAPPSQSDREESLVVAEPYNPPMPDPLSAIFWAAMARRYRNHPGVLFDLLNEPHEARPNERWDAPYRSGAADRPITAPKDPFWQAEWQNWARYLHRIVTGSPASEFGNESTATKVSLKINAPVLVAGFGGSNWAASVEARGRTGGPPAWPVLLSSASSGSAPLPGVIYKVHWYWHKGIQEEVDWRRLINAPPKGDESWAHPVFLGEWGAETRSALLGDQSTGPDDQGTYETLMAGRVPDGPDMLLKWSKSLLAFLEGRAAWSGKGAWKGICGWTAWSVGNGPHIVAKRLPIKCDGPFLAGDRPGTVQLTDYGSVVVDALRPVVQLDSAGPIKLVLTDPASKTRQLKIQVRNGQATPLCGYECKVRVVASSQPAVQVAIEDSALARDSALVASLTALAVGSASVEVTLEMPSRPNQVAASAKVDVEVVEKE